MSKMPQWIREHLSPEKLNMSVFEVSQLAKNFFHDMAKPLSEAAEKSIEKNVDALRFVRRPPPPVTGAGVAQAGGPGAATATGGVGAGGEAVVAAVGVSVTEVAVALTAEGSVHAVQAVRVSAVQDAPGAVVGAADGGSAPPSKRLRAGGDFTS